MTTELELCPSLYSLLVPLLLYSSFLSLFLYLLVVSKNWGHSIINLSKKIKTLIVNIA